MLIKLFTGAVYVAMVVVNFLANSLPINGRSTGDISDAYVNLFAPAGITFSIWGLIYILLGGYVVYQMIHKDTKRDELFKKINPLFIATSFANISWIFAWHYDYIALSVVIMAVLLFLLIQIANIIRGVSFTILEKILIRAPFSIYFGWITVAMIANITVLLVSLQWNGFGIPDYVWTSVVLCVGAVIGIARMQLDKNLVYGSVLIWAYGGILVRHLSLDGFAGQYLSIIITAGVCIALVLFFGGRIFYKNK